MYVKEDWHKNFEVLPQWGVRIKRISVKGTMRDDIQEYSDYPLVSIVITCYNNRNYIKNCIGSVLNCKYPNFEVIFLDNASSDGSFGLAKTLYGIDPRIKFIKNPENLGAAQAFNIGGRIAHGKYVVYLNCDTVVESSWLEELVDVMESDPAIGAAQSKILLLENPKIVDSAGYCNNFYGIGYNRGHLEEDKGQYNEVKEISFAKGAAMLVRKNVLEEAGYFDPNFFMYGEETDLCWRIWLLGYNVVFIPRSVVYHAGSASSSQLGIAFQTYYRIRNNLILVLKNYSLTSCLRFFPGLILYCLIYFIFSVYERTPLNALAIIKAFLACASDFRQIWSQHLEVQHHIRRVTDGFIRQYAMKKIPIVHYVFRR